LLRSEILWRSFRLSKKKGKVIPLIAFGLIITHFEATENYNHKKSDAAVDDEDRRSVNDDVWTVSIITMKI